jgi:integrase
MAGCRRLTDTEVRRVKKVLGDSQRDLCLFILGLRTGFRISELLRLKVSDVAGMKKATVAKQGMKGKLRERTVILHPEAIEAIDAYLKESQLPPESWLFPSRKCQGEAITRHHGWVILKNAYNALGMTGKVATHSMRKTFAMNVYTRLGKDVLKTGKALGHVDGYAYKNTERYLEVDQDEINDAILGE